MKRSVCMLLVLAAVLSLLSGCAGGGETQPTGTQPTVTQPTETQPTEPPAPPRTAKELVPRLNEALKAQNIPVEFIRHQNGDAQSSYWNPKTERHEACSYALYLPMVSTDGKTATSDRFDLSVEYLESTDAVVKLQIWVGDTATEEERQLHRQICAVAAQLCDEALTQAQAEALPVTEPSPTAYLAHKGEFTSFTSGDSWGGKGWFYPNFGTVIFQPRDLTHTYYTSLEEDQAFYELYFTDAEDRLWQELEVDGMTVEELEQNLNAALETLGVPVTCRMLPYRERGSWKPSFRFTTLDDPNYAYPEFPYDVYGTDVEPEFVERYIRNNLNWTDLSVWAIDPIAKDSPIRTIHLSYYSAIPQLDQALVMACDPEAEDYQTLQSLPVIDDGTGWPRRELEKENYVLTEILLDDGTKSYNIQNSEALKWRVEDISPEQMMDPALMEYEFQLAGPLVQDGRFHANQAYDTVFGSFSDYLDFGDIMNDYLACTRSGVAVEATYSVSDSGNWRFYTGIHASSYSGDPATMLDPGTFYIIYPSESDGYEIYMAYNTNVEQYLTEGMDKITLENLLRIPIGLSLLADESMTAEAAVGMHTDTGEYDFLSGERDKYVLPSGYQTKVFGTGEVIHVLGEKPETGDRWYSVICRDFVENSSDYRHLLDYLEE